MLQGSSGAHAALQSVGEILAAEGSSAAIVVVGGTALNLIGATDRTTRDVDVIAFGNPPEADQPLMVQPSTTLPPSLERAAHLTATQLGLDRDWLNLGPSLQWKQGFPDGFQERIHWKKYGALMVGIASRVDLIALKLFAAADQGRSTVHYQDLLTLNPSISELVNAERWVLTMDASSDYPAIVQDIISHVRQHTQ